MDKENENPNLEAISQEPTIESEPTVELVENLPNTIPESEATESKLVIDEEVSTPTPQENIISDTEPTSAPKADIANSPINTEDNSVSNQSSQPKKSHKGLIVFLIILVVSLCAAGLIWFLARKPTPENVFDLAVKNFESAKNISLTSTNNFNFKNPELSGAKNATAEFHFSSLELPTEGSLDLNFLTVDDDEIFISLKTKISADGEIFLNLENLENFLDDMSFSPVLEMFLGEDFYRFAVSELDGEWWQLDKEGIDTIFSATDANSDYDAIATCFKNSDFNSRDLSFISPSETKTDSKDTFLLKFDSDKFAEKNESFLSCFNSSTNELKDELENFMGELPEVFAEVDDSNHFSKIYTSNRTEDYQLESVVEFSYSDKKSTFSLPESYLPLSDLVGLFTIHSDPIEIEYLDDF